MKTTKKHVIRLGLAVLVALLVAAPAAASVSLTHSEPAPSAGVRSAPTQVVLDFDGPVRPAPAIAVSRGGAGSVVAGKPYVPDGKPNEVVIPLKGGLGPGPYAVNWSVVDAGNGGTVGGAFVFSVGGGLPAKPTETIPQSGSSGAPAGLWLVVAGLLVAAACAVFFLVRRTRALAVGVGAGLIVAAAGAVLWVVNPGESSLPTAAPAQPATSKTVVYAGEDDDLAVALALTPKGHDALGMRATVLGFTGPAKGLGLRFAVDTHSASATSCGPGCYGASLPLAGRPRDIAVTIARKRHPTATLHFAGPSKWPAPDGLDIVQQAAQTISGLSTLVVHSRLASDAHHEVTTDYKMVAPNRLEFRNGDGSGSVIIGNRRWDRQAGKNWVKSQQLPPISQPAPFWTPQVADAHVLRTGTVDGRPVWVVSFLDRSTPAWFTAWVDRSSYRTLRLEMVAVAHFMHDRDGPFNTPISIEPPGA